MWGAGERGDGNQTGPCARARPRAEDLTAQLLTSQPCRQAPPPSHFTEGGRGLNGGCPPPISPLVGETRG